MLKGCQEISMFLKIQFRRVINGGLFHTSHNELDSALRNPYFHKAGDGSPKYDHKTIKTQVSTFEV